MGQKIGILKFMIGLAESGGSVLEVRVKDLGFSAVLRCWSAI